jgi:D-beta-D-heptose 7-phosphate kinase/D-beta-D-heptose 1-phosphate adenosyltransferase
MSPLTPPAQSKIFTLDQLVKLREKWKKKGKQVVFTNGCFDILHAGHIQYLEAAARMGDRLIVAVNEDDSVRRLKGPSRPINVLNSRMYLLASLQCVDAVCSFPDDTPLEVIKELRPDVLVKGGDYKSHEIIGAEEVNSWGGQVEVIPFVEGYSTTKLESRILELYKSKKQEDR